MNSLPELAGGRIHYRLPLAEETAIRLAGVLLAESLEQRSERLEAALSCDPPLAVWAVLVAPEPADSTAPLPSLVAWLAPRLPRLLASSSAMPQGAGWDAARQGEFDRLLADARRSAASFAGGQGMAGGQSRRRSESSVRSSCGRCRRVADAQWYTAARSARGHRSASGMACSSAGAIFGASRWRRLKRSGRPILRPSGGRG